MAVADCARMRNDDAYKRLFKVVSYEVIECMEMQALSYHTAMPCRIK